MDKLWIPGLTPGNPGPLWTDLPDGIIFRELFHRRLHNDFQLTLRLFGTFTPIHSPYYGYYGI